jgi:hypothetical protein
MSGFMQPTLAGFEAIAALKDAGQAGVPADGMRATLPRGIRHSLLAARVEGRALFDCWQLSLSVVFTIRLGGCGNSCRNPVFAMAVIPKSGAGFAEAD